MFHIKESPFRVGSGVCGWKAMEATACLVELVILLQIIIEMYQIPHSLEVDAGFWSTMSDDFQTCLSC